MKKLFIVIAVIGGISLIAGCEKNKCSTCTMTGQTPVKYCEQDLGSSAAYDQAVSAARSMGYDCSRSD